MLYICIYMYVCMRLFNDLKIHACAHRVQNRIYKNCFAKKHIKNKHRKLKKHSFAKEKKTKTKQAFLFGLQHKHSTRPCPYDRVSSDVRSAVRRTCSVRLVRCFSLPCYATHLSSMRWHFPNCNDCVVRSTGKYDIQAHLALSAMFNVPLMSDRCASIHIHTHIGI